MRRGCLWMALFPSVVGDAAAKDDASGLAQPLQNPIGNLNSAPFQNNANFGGFHNVVTPHYAPTWRLRSQVALIF